MKKKEKSHKGRRKGLFHSYEVPLLRNWQTHGPVGPLSERVGQGWRPPSISTTCPCPPGSRFPTSDSCKWIAGENGPFSARVTEHCSLHMGVFYFSPRKVESASYCNQLYGCQCQRDIHLERGYSANWYANKSHQQGDAADTRGGSHTLCSQ